jgi:hypothetical protein
MDPSLRIVTQTPLTILWTDKGELPYSREKNIGKETIKELLKNGPLQFVVANPGEKLRWISLEDCYQFWKKEVQPHLPETEKIFLEDFRDEYAYIASLWTCKNAQPIIVMETLH